MGNKVSRVVAGCFVPKRKEPKGGPVLMFSKILDGGLGHSFYYARPAIGSPPNHQELDSIVLASSKLSFNNADAARAAAVDSVSTIVGAGNLHHKNSEMGSQMGGCWEKSRSQLSETSFKAISGASVSANITTPRTLISQPQFNSFSNILFDQAAAFESTSSFTALPLQPVPCTARGGGLSELSPIPGAVDNDCFCPNPLERGFLSGPLEMISMSGPLELVDKTNFSAPLEARPHKPTRFRANFARTVSLKSVRKAMIKTISKTRRSIVLPVMKFVMKNEEEEGVQELIGLKSSHVDLPLDLGTCCTVSSELEDTREWNKCQWAQAKAGEDRVHVVVSEEHGLLFVGIYDGFNGPDAPDFLMSNLYPAIYRELKKSVWDQNDEFNSKAKESEKIGLVDGQAGGKLDTPFFKVADATASKVRLVNDPHGEFSDQVMSNEISQENEDCREDRRVYSCNCQSTIDEHAPQTTLVTVKHNPDPTSLMPENIVAQEILISSKTVDGERIAPPLEPQEGTRLAVEEGGFCNGRLYSEQANEEVDSNGWMHLKTSQQKANVTGKKNVKAMPVMGRKTRQNWHRKQHWRFLQSSISRYAVEQQSHEVEEQLHEKLQLEQEARDCEWGGTINHDSVLKALACALNETENAYLEMAHSVLHENPELMMMGSCVLVMLMKDEDVYIMNVGDSRAILACKQSNQGSFSRTSKASTTDSGMTSLNNSQQTCHELDEFSTVSGDRDVSMKLELENIIEETTIELEAFETVNDIVSCVLVSPATSSSSLNALQLSKDHTTSNDQEVQRVRAEHPNDHDIISNDRVKGRLNVTRAFGVGFLKQPQWNNALLEMFRCEFVGSDPYITCEPFLHHHKLGPQDQFLILSSDGLYQYLSNEEAVAHVEWFLEKFPDGDPAQNLIEELLFRAAKKNGMNFHELLDVPHGDRRKYHDDICVMVISFEGRIWRSSCFTTHLAN